MFKFLAAIFISASFLGAVQLRAEDEIAAKRKKVGLCDQDLLRAGLILGEPITERFKALAIETTRVLPAAVAAFRQNQQDGIPNPLEVPAEGPPLEGTGVDAPETQDDKEFKAWRDEAYARKDLPSIQPDIPPELIGPDWSKDSVQLVTLKGQKKIYRPLSHGDPMADFVCAKSKATYSTSQLAKFLFGKKNRVPDSIFVRFGNEVGVLSDYIEGDAKEAPSLKKKSLRNLDPDGFDEMVVLNFLIANGDLFWGRVEIQGKLSDEPGWRGIFLVDGKYTVAFDFNISAKAGFATHTDESLMGSILPETYSPALVERLKLLNTEILRSFGYTTLDSQWILYYRDILLKDQAMHKPK